MKDVASDERAVEVGALGEQLGTLRLCEPAAVVGMQHSLVRHGQLSALSTFAVGARLELIDGFKRLRAVRALGWREVRARVLGVDAVGAKIALATLHDGAGLTELEQGWLVRN